MLLRVFAFVLLLGPAAAHAEVGERPHTAGPTVSAFLPPLRMPQSGFARRLRVYLPPDYASGAKRYPVIYMFDGQNLFDEATSYVGEWGVDEAMDALAREGFSAIVVGIDHGGDMRFHELIPYWNVRFLPNLGEAFLDDVVLAIKPFIDANYRTLPDRGHTAIIGSSLGGLEADYAIRRHPQVFGRAGVFSPSYWVSDDAFTQAARDALPADTRVYLYMGGREGGDSVQHVERMAQLLRTHLPVDNVAVSIAAEAEHNERAWRAEFPVAVRWLFAVADPKKQMEHKGR